MFHLTGPVLVGGGCGDDLACSIAAAVDDDDDDASYS